jgi:hypothetical protein
MHTAVESAALEGLRGFDPSDPASDQAGRDTARSMVQLTFDDNLNLANGDSLNFGAGPVIALTGGIPLPTQTGGTLMASQFLDRSNSGVYKPYSPGIAPDQSPNFQLNASNQQYGDMVRGTFTGGVASEDAGYTRGDFSPSAAGNSLLVRMRRTNNAAGLDQVSGISSSGPVLPYLFGRGTLMHADPASQSNVDPRMHGIPVRATTIAQARPALSAGRPSTAPLLPGVASFALELAEWNSLAENVPVSGSPVNDHPIDQRMYSFGQVLVDASVAPPPTSGFAYVPIYTQLSGGDPNKYVIGFAFVEFEASGVVPRSKKMAPQNASTAIVNTVPPVGSGANFQALWTASQNLQRPLLAPALVR